MRIEIVTPAPAGSRLGNRGTAVRWAGLLRELGHTVSVATAWTEARVDMLIALHARRSHASLARFATALPGRPRLLVLTGTDLYRDIRDSADAVASLALAHRIVVLQAAALAELPAGIAAKTTVVYQSAVPVARKATAARHFDILVVGHLREEKDPFRCALAASRVPAESRLRVLHLGGSLSEAMARQAEDLMRREPRYRWLGEVQRWRVRRHMARAAAMVISSRMEGGANVVSEALAAGLPILASRVSGNVGMLGEDYEGYFPVEDERALARLLVRAETDPRLLEHLRRQCAARAVLVTREAERASLAAALQAAVRAAGCGTRSHAEPGPG